MERFTGWKGTGEDSTVRKAVRKAEEIAFKRGQQSTQGRVAELESALEALTGVVERELEVMDKVHARKKTLRDKIDVLADSLNKIDEANFNAKQTLEPRDTAHE